MPAPDSFGVNCPFGGTFYSGINIPYLGCCTTDPSTTDDGQCPPDSIRAASFDPAAYSQITKQECAAPDSGAEWYTCAGIKPPFMGCCTINACAKNGCPQANLAAAKANSDPDLAMPFINPSKWASTASTATPSSSTTATSTSATSATSVTSTSSTSSESPSSTSSSSSTATHSDHQGLQTGAVVGLAIGTAAAVSIIAILLFWIVRRKRRLAQRHHYASPGTPSMAGDGKSVAPSPATPQWSFNHAESYAKTVPYQSLQQDNGTSEPYATSGPYQISRQGHANEGRYSVPPEYSAVTTGSPAPTELPGSARTAVFELHGDTSPEIGGSGFTPR
ncbi:hypothetical protein NLG97_g8436 [Lecanicillium saksenae]|uniref:Uncharacterized protein n=1 Tax=Lecanicillium saksenae TaxID=468837 RepID=A0ACC1QLB2_9HYPO|nr:hypothetical protein NLG97_g8436 [Lecanicillium saksenae]